MGVGGKVRVLEIENEGFSLALVSHMEGGFALTDSQQRSASSTRRELPC